MAGYRREQLEQMGRSELVTLILAMQEQTALLSAQVEQLNKSMESLIEQIRIANSYRFGKHTEKLSSLYDGQYSLFDEAESLAPEAPKEPEFEEAVPRRKKQKGKSDADLRDFPVEEVPVHRVPEEELIRFFGEGNYRSLPDEQYRKLKYVPASWIAELHTVEVYVGTKGERQDEFLRGKHSRNLLKGSILTSSLGAAILNGKFVNSIPLDRIEKEFERDGVNISKQTMANWVIALSNRYLTPLWERMKEKLLSLHVNQCDETPVQVIRDKSPSGNDQGYMWVHRSGEFYKDFEIVLFEYNKSRSHEVPLEFYKDYHGVLVTDSLSQYHLLEKKLSGITSANCWAHARRSYADALKAIGSKNADAIRQSTAWKALKRISTIYELEGALRDLSPGERLKARRKDILPIVDEYFSWVKETLSQMLPKGKTAEGLNFSLNQEKYLRAYLSDGEVPIDNSATERALRTFCVGKKNWMFINSVKGADASAVVYSVTETAKLNGLKPYAYLNHLLTELPELLDDEGKVMDTAKLDALLPWSKTLPDICYKQRRD